MAVAETEPPSGMTVLIPKKELTAADLDSLPSDGSRWELIDGSLHVTPPPRTRHQLVAGRLYSVLYDAHPPGTVVFGSPVGYRPHDRTTLEPDLLVARADDVGELRIEPTPLLIVEVLSPSTRLYDLGTKRLTYEALGVPSYWLVDPNDPRVTVLELVDGHYQEAAEAGPGEVLDVERPFPVSIEIDRLHDV